MIKVIFSNKAVFCGGFEESERRLFIENYRDLIGELSKEHHSRLWWSTDMASKNRFKSTLAHRLQEFLEAIKTIDSANDGQTVHVKCSLGVAKALKKLYQHKPVSFKHEPDMISRKINTAVIRLRSVGGFLVEALWTLRRVFLAKYLARPLKDRLPSGEACYLFKTFIYDHSFDQQGQYRDVFFGRLPQEIAKTRSIRIIGNILGNFRKNLKVMQEHQAFPVIALEECLRIRDVLKAVIDIFTYRIEFKSQCMFQGYAVEDIVREEYQRSYKGIQIYQYCHYYAMKNLLKKMNCSHLLLTYEHNPWELMSLMAVQESAVKPITIGYQHTVVPQASLNMFPSAMENGIMPIPDRILTVGLVNQEIMESYGIYPNGKIQPACALRFEYLQQLSLQERRGPIKRILLAIEGVLEAHPMVDYVFEQLGDDARFEVLVRTHPTMPWAAFEKAFNYRLSSRAHFKVSSGTSLMEDIIWSDAVIYWGSTVGIEAAAMGRPAINFMTGSVVNFDPLFLFQDLKWVVRKESSLTAVISGIDALTDTEYKTRQKNTQAYIKRYFYPLTTESFTLFQ